jgi:hypothetical protein
MSTEKRAQNVASGRMSEDGTRVTDPVPAPEPEGGRPDASDGEVIDVVAEAEAVAAAAVDPSQEG